MRRLRLLNTVLLGCALAACQDGPNQTYAPPPPSAQWNDGRASPSDGGMPGIEPGDVSSSTAPYALPDGGPIATGGNNANEICTQQQIAEVNPVLNTAPIVPPNGAANLNLAGVDDAGNVTWQGLTIQQAEQINCQGTTIPSVFLDLDTLDVYWNSGSVLVEYSTTNQKVIYIGVGPGINPVGGGGYRGYLGCNPQAPAGDPSACVPPAKQLTSPLSGNTYVIAVDGTTAITVIPPGGAPQTISPGLDWVDASNGVPSAVKPFDDLYRALMATYLPAFPSENPSVTCNQTGACNIGTFAAGANAAFFVPALNIVLWVSPYYNSVAANAINRVDVQYAQILPFSGVSPVLKLDAVGPESVPQQIAPSGSPCVMQLGEDFNDFQNNCVETSASAATNLSTDLELFSGLSHDEETFQFNILGMDMSFGATPRLGPTQTVVDVPPQGCAADQGNVSDIGCPEAPDLSMEINVDENTLGLVANDWTFDDAGTPLIHDLHGIGALYDDYRALTVQSLESEICAGAPAFVDAGALPDAGLLPGGPLLYPSQVNCPYWQATPLEQQIANCVAPRDAQGNLTGSLAGFAPVGCTGMENLLSTDVTTPDDPVNIGPIASQIDADYSLGMKMGHQQGVFCVDAMSRNQIAEQSATVLCPSGASQCPFPGQTGFTCPTGTCDPTAGTCPAGTPTCTGDAGGAPVPLTVAQVDQIGEVGIGPFVNGVAAAGIPPQPAGTEVLLTLPQDCVAGSTLPQSQAQSVAALAGGNASLMPVDIRDNRFFFKIYGYALLQTLEASGANGQLDPCPGQSSGVCPVTSWGAPTLGTNEPIQNNDLYFDSDGDGQFETMEYVDRRFVCPDGASDCAPAGSTGFTCNPAVECDVNNPPAGGCAASGLPLCNAAETAQPPLDLQFTADVKDGIMNAYDINRWLYRGESAFYNMIQNPGHAVAQQSNALMSAIFGSPLLTNPNVGCTPVSATECLWNNDQQTPVFPGVDLTGQPLNLSDYLPVFTGTPLTLSYGGTTSPLVIAQTFPGGAGPNGAPDAGPAGEALVTYPVAAGASTDETLIPWVPDQPGNGFYEANPNNATLDQFVQTASIDFTGITTSALVDYQLTGIDGGMQEQAVESQNYLGDVFLCYEPAASPPLLAVRMYTPTAAVLQWLTDNPQAYSDCGIVVRWSPFENYVSLIEFTTYGVRLQVTQGGGLGRVVGAQLYVPGTAFEE